MPTPTRSHPMSPRTRLCLWCSAALAAALASSGCASPAERAAEQLVEKNAAARGGLEAWRRVQSMALSGSLEAGVPRDPLAQAQASLRARTETKAGLRRELAHREGAAPAKQVALPFTLELKRPRSSRLELVFQGQRAVQVYDGARGWKVRPFLGRHEVEPYTAEELALASQQAALDGPLLDHAAKGDRVKLVGTEQVEGRDTYKLEVTSRSGQARHVWVDGQTFLEVRVDGTRRMDGKPRQVLTWFRDYRPVGGLLIPHTLETTVEGVAGSEKIVIEQVSLNPALADARFSKPE